MDKYKLFNVLTIVSYLGLGICFIGFGAAPFSAIRGGGMPNFSIILFFFFGFAFCGVASSICYRHSGFYAKHLQDIGDNIGTRGSNETIYMQKQVVIRCRNCGTLNDEGAIYCKQCGEKL